MNATLTPSDSSTLPLLSTCLNAVIADGTMRTSGRTVELAGHTPLHPHGDAIDVRVLVQWRPELVLTVLVRWGWKEGEGSE